MLINIATHVHDTKYFFLHLPVDYYKYIPDPSHIMCTKTLWNNINIHVLFFTGRHFIWKTLVYSSIHSLLESPGFLPEVTLAIYATDVHRTFLQMPVCHTTPKWMTFTEASSSSSSWFCNKPKVLYYYSNTCCTSSLVCSVPMHGHF